MSNRIRFTTLASSLLLASTAAIAFADDATGAPVRFTALAPDGARSEVAAELHLGIATEDEDDDNLIGGHLDAQYLNAQGLGGYARLGFASVEDSQGLTGAEVGALYRRASGKSAIAVRGGLTLPTGPDTDDEDFIAPYVGTIISRPSDLAMALPETSALRLSVSPSYADQAFFARADLGLDVYLSGPGDDNPDPMYHADFGLGLRQGAAAATFEFSTLGSTDDSDEGLLHAISVGGQIDTGSAIITGRLGTPFSSGDGLSIDAGDIVTATIGVSVPM